MKSDSFSEDEWKTVKARIQTMPSNMSASVGGTTFTKNELLKQIDEKTSIGELLVKIHFNYLRSFKKEASVLL